jgi:hypothetical protein
VTLQQGRDHVPSGPPPRGDFLEDHLGRRQVSADVVVGPAPIASAPFGWGRSLRSTWLLLLIRALVTSASAASSTAAAAAVSIHTEFLSNAPFVTSFASLGR